MELPQTTFRFGELEAILADINEIPSVQRTSFQARLKDIQRQGLLRMEEQPRGKAASYGVRELALMAIAVEMCQFGLSTKRAVEVMLADEYPMWMAVMMAASAIRGRPEVFNPGPGNAGNPPDQETWGFSPEWRDASESDPLSMFLYFDPSILAPWEELEGGEKGQDIASATFFYAGAGIVGESVSRWTTGPTRRIALINVTKLIFDLGLRVAGPDGLAVIREFEEVADAWVHRGDFDLDGWLANIAKSLGMMVAGNPGPPSWLSLKDLVEANKGAFGQYLVPVQQETEKDRALAGARQLPDLIIRLPGQRELMVDAKTSPVADIPQRGIDWRLEELATEPYRGQFADRTKYVVLYIPSEDFLAAAMAADKTLIDRALAQNVLIATPAIFLNLLAEVAVAWDKYRKEFPDFGEEEFEALVLDPRKGLVDGNG